MEHGQADALRAGRRRRVLITGAGGQLGSALREAFAADDVVALDYADWDVTLPAPAGLAVPDLALHAAAWTDVDGAEEDPQGAAAVNVGGTANVAALGAPLVYFSTDYVFDGRKGQPYVESDAANPQSAYGRSKLHGEAAAGEDAWIVRTSWLFGPTGKNFLRTMLRLAEERAEVRVVADQRGSPTYTGHLALCHGGSRRPRPRNLAPGRGRRVHVGRVCRSNLRRGRRPLPSRSHHHGGARPTCSAPRLLGPAQ